MGTKPLFFFPYYIFGLLTRVIVCRFLPHPPLPQGVTGAQAFLLQPAKGVERYPSQPLPSPQQNSLKQDWTALRSSLHSEFSWLSLPSQLKNEMKWEPGLQVGHITKWKGTTQITSIFFGRRNDPSYAFSQIYVIYTATYIRNISLLVIKTHAYTYTYIKYMGLAKKFIRVMPSYKKSKCNFWPTQNYISNNASVESHPRDTEDSEVYTPILPLPLPSPNPLSRLCNTSQSLSFFICEMRMKKMLPQS